MPEIVGSARMPRLASPPASPTQGEMYFNTVDHILYYWNGSAWISTQSSSGTIYDSDQIGTVKAFSGRIIPTNWMLAANQLVNRADYPQLADQLAIPVEQTTFNIPDYRDKFLYGATATDAQMGTIGGVAVHTLAATEMPVHQHAGTTGNMDRSLDHYHYHGYWVLNPEGPNNFFAAGAGGNIHADYWDLTANADRGLDHLHPFTTDNRGGSAGVTQPHTNMPPWIKVAWIIKVTGVQIDSGGALKGADGRSFEVYEQATEPVTGTVGAMWIDTDDSPQAFLGYIPLVTSLPAVPTDGMEVYYVVDAANGILWHLRYRAASSSAYKWESIGGPRLFAEWNGSQATSYTPTYGSMQPIPAARTMITLPLSGDYDIKYGTAGQAQSTVQDIFTTIYDRNTNVALDDSYHAWWRAEPSNYAKGTVMTSTRLTAQAAGRVIEVRVQAAGANVWFYKAWIEALPLRVG